MRTGETGLTVFRLLTKQNLWVWVQSNGKLVYKNGQPDCIITSQRVITYVLIFVFAIYLVSLFILNNL